MAVIPYGADIVSTPPDTSLLAAWQLSPAGYYLVVCRLEPENHVREIIEELKDTTSSERSGRAQDQESTYAMQKLRAKGYM